MQFSQIIDGEKHKVSELEDIQAWSQFIYQNNQLIILDDNKYLWQYDLGSQSKSLLLKTIENMKTMSDIDLDNKRLLATQVVSAKKEIVMFHD